jgi:hypothetical protein
MNDWFEENISRTDPSIYNARFVILLRAELASWDYTTPYVMEPAREFFIEKQGIPAENVFLLTGNWQDGATLSNFEQAVTSVAQRSDPESLVFVFLWTHGGGDPPQMCFSDGNGTAYGDTLKYSEVGKMLSNISCKRVWVAYRSCAYETALTPLAEEITGSRVVVLADWLSLIYAMGGSLRYYNQSDANGDCYVSVREAVDYLIEFNETHYDPSDEPYLLVEMVDESNIASTIYFGDYNPDIDIFY